MAKKNGGKDSKKEAVADTKTKVSASDIKQASKESEQSAGFNLVEFLKGTKEELDKVYWPSRQQLVSESLAVILMVIVSAATIYLVDNIFGWAAKQVFG